MRKSAFVFLIFSALPTLASAAPQPGQIIWSNLLYGMTKEQVSGLYPDRKVDLGNTCTARLDPAFDKGQLVYVTMTGAGEGCSESVLQSLQLKYGKPRTDEIKLLEQRESIGRALQLRKLGIDPKQPYDELRLLSWFANNTLITLQVNETMRNWTISYEPAELKTILPTDKL